VATIFQPIRYRVTMTGILFLMALLLTGAAAFFSANNLLFLIFSAMLAFLLVSGFLSRLVLAGLELELLLPEHVSARCATDARIRIRNLKRLTPSFSLELTGRPDPVSNTPSILNTPLYFPLIPGGGAIEASIQVTFPFRGKHRENVFAVSTRFPFGFLRKTTVVPLRRDTIVYPALEPGEGDALLLDRVRGEIEAEARGSGLDFYRIRPYEASDNARLVDWKTTAHTGALQVREFTREERPPIEVYLDCRIAPGANERFEHAVERCAYVVWNLADAAPEIRFRSQRCVYTTPEDGDVYGILRYLAVAEAVVILGDIDDVAEMPVEDGAIRIAFTERPEAFETAGWWIG
jgi:uncharacterized protein (DUF58 family)